MFCVRCPAGRSPNIIVANFRPLYSPIRNFTAWRAYAAGYRHRIWLSTVQIHIANATEHYGWYSTSVLRWLRNINSSFTFRYVTVCFGRKRRCLTLLREKWWAFEICLFLKFSIYLPQTALAERERMWCWAVLVYLKNSAGQNEGKPSKCPYIFDANCGEENL